MKASPLSGDAAIRATLEAKISVARLRSLHAPTKAQREEQAEALVRYEKKLAELGRAMRAPLRFSIRTPESMTLYTAKVYFRNGKREPEERDYEVSSYDELVLATKNDPEVIAFSLVDWKTA